MLKIYILILIIIAINIVNGDIIKRGFGCPFDEQKCHLHCQSVERRGGFCGGFLRMTCKCYNN